MVKLIMGEHPFSTKQPARSGGSPVSIRALHEATSCQ